MNNSKIVRDADAGVRGPVTGQAESTSSSPALPEFRAMLDGRVYWCADWAALMRIAYVNRDPRFYKVLFRYHDLWWKKGGGLMCAFDFTGPYAQYGSWGYLEYQDQPLNQSPKYRALTDAIKGH